MPGTAETVFNLGDKYWCVSPDIPEPLLGTIVNLTAVPGKLIGLEFAQDVGSLHNCENTGEMCFCAWTFPGEIYTEAEWVVFGQSVAAEVVVRQALIGPKYKSITIDEDGSIIAEGSFVTKYSADEDAGIVLPAHKE